MGAKENLIRAIRYEAALEYALQRKAEMRAEMEEKQNRTPGPKPEVRMIVDMTKPQPTPMTEGIEFPIRPYETKETNN